MQKSTSLEYEPSSEPIHIQLHSEIAGEATPGKQSYRKGVSISNLSSNAVYYTA